MSSGDAIEVTLVSASKGSPLARERQPATPSKPVAAESLASAQTPSSPSPAGAGEGRRASPDDGKASTSTQPGAIDPAVGADYRQRLLAHIQPFRRFPTQAQDADARGIVQLIFMVDQRGSVVGVWVKSSSGFEVLDAEAVATVLRAQPMPRVPPGLPAPLTVQLPVSFNPS
uniref:TonB family protein n=1 Tax=Caulobacter sp. (strain K31) TaxID=366602 RepID=B0T7P1_CAUSK